MEEEEDMPVCCKASCQLNILRRIGFFFDEVTR